ncbi:hypothetical protein G6F65_020189 [Rhizopus arrhizus]|nr:hypothetical protein G6F65_020189 [Rhizopus arrhizus]
MKNGRFPADWKSAPGFAAGCSAGHRCAECRPRRTRVTATTSRTAGSRPAATADQHADQRGDAGDLHRAQVGLEIQAVGEQQDVAAQVQAELHRLVLELRQRPGRATAGTAPARRTAAPPPAPGPRATSRGAKTAS